MRSSSGEGTTVEVWLPASVNVPADRATVRENDVGPRGQRILVVEDEDSVRALVERILGRAGYEVVPAESSDRALALYRQEPRDFDLVLTDVVMPGMTGLELTARVRALTPDQAVLLMSGYSQELLTPGRPEPVALIPKPFSHEALCAAVHDALATPVTRDAARRGTPGVGLAGPAAGPWSRTVTTLPSLG